MCFVFPPFYDSPAAPLRAEIMPKRLTVRSGEDVTVNCTYYGGPVHSVQWLKDQRPLLTDHRVRQLGRLVLHVSSFRREDTGMYQCFVSNDADSAQGHALLKIEGTNLFLTACIFVAYFSS